VRPRPAAGLLAVLAAALAASLVAVAVVRDDAAPPGLRLGPVTPSVADGTLTVDTSVAAVAQQSGRYYVWFELTPAGGGRATFVSERVSGTARPPDEGAEPVTIRQALDVPAGAYRLAVWLHTRVRGVEAEADRWAADLDLDGLRPAGLRSWAPRDVVIASTKLRTSRQSPAAVTGTVRLRNISGRAQTVRLGIGLTDSTDARPTPTTRWAPPQPVALPAGASRDVAVAADLPLWPGSYRPTVEVRAGDDLLDQFTGATAVEVGLDPDLARSSLPAGRLMIAAADPPANWKPGTRHDLAVAVVNLTGSAVTARLLPVMAPAGVDKPWEHSRLSCTAADTRVPAHGRVTLRVRCLRAGAGPGDRISLWVHEKTAHGFTHSDGVSALAPVGTGES